MNRCKTCKSWSREKIPEYAEVLMSVGVFGVCEMFCEQYTAQPWIEYKNTVIYGDAEGLAFAITGEDFGCILYVG